MRATANPDTNSHPLEHGLRCVIVWTDGDEKAVQKSVMAFSYVCDSLIREDDMKAIVSSVRSSVPFASSDYVLPWTPVPSGG
jgi:hypothetical protein